MGRDGGALEFSTNGFGFGFILCNMKHFWPFIEEGYVKMFLRGRPVTMYMPKEQVESYNLEAKVELPAKRLKLEWVYPFCAGD